MYSNWNKGRNVIKWHQWTTRINKSSHGEWKVTAECNGLPSPDVGFFQPWGYVVPFTPCPKDWLVDFLAAEPISKKKQLLFLFYLVVELRFSWKKHRKHKIYAMVESSASFSTGIEKLGEKKSLFIDHIFGLKHRKKKDPQNILLDKAAILSLTQELKLSV